MADNKAPANNDVPRAVVSSDIQILDRPPPSGQAEVNSLPTRNRAIQPSPDGTARETFENNLKGSNAGGLTGPPPFTSARIPKVEDRETSAQDTIALKSPAMQAELKSEYATGYFNMAHSLLMECKAARNPSDLESAIGLLRCAASSFPTGDSQLKECHNNLAAALLARFSCTGEGTNVEEAHISLTRALETPGADSGIEGENRSEAMLRALELLTQFYQAADLQTLEKAATLYRKALSLQKAFSPLWWRSLSELSEVLILKLYHNGNTAQVDEAVARLRFLLRPKLSVYLAAALLVPTYSQGHETARLLYMKDAAGALLQAMDSNRAALELADAGQNLGDMFEQSMDIQDLNTAIEKLKQATLLLSWGHASQGSVWDTLSRLLLNRYRETRKLEDLAESIDSGTEALALYPNVHPDRSRSLYNLGNALQMRFDHMGDFNDLEETIRLHREALSLRPSPHPDRGNSVNNIGVAVETRYEQMGELNDLQEAIELYREALILNPNLHPTHAGSLSNLARAIHTLYQRTGDFNDLEEAIRLHRESLTLRPAPHADRAISLNSLANAVETRYKQKGNFNDLEEAIELNREALALHPSPHCHRSTSLNNLANKVQTRYEQKGGLKDLEEAIQLHRESLALRPTPHPNRGISLANLSNAVHERYKQKGDLDDLEEAINLNREALAHHPSSHYYHGKSLNNLANTIQTRYQLKGDFKDLDEAIVLHRQALATRPSPHPERGSSLNNLANTVQTRYQQQGDFNDLEEAIVLYREALELHPVNHPYHGASLNSLADAVHTRYMQKGDFGDLEQVICLHRRALALHPTPHPGRGGALNNLANAVKSWYEHKGDLNALEEVIGLHREALTLHPAPHRYHSMSLSNLAAAVQTRYERKGNFNDIEEAIRLLREALTFCPTTNPSRHTFLTNLANTVHIRYKQKKDINDLEEVIRLQEQVLTFCPTPHPKHDRALSNLAVAVQSRYIQKRDFNDLQKAIGLLRQALADCPAPHPGRGSALNNLAVSLQSQYNEKGEFSDIQEAIRLHGEALTLRPAPHIDRASSLLNLATAVQIRSKRNGDSNDLEQACELLQEVLAICTPPHPYRGGYLANFARVLTDKYESTLLEDNLHAAISLFREASTYIFSSPLQRFHHTHFWAQKAAQHGHSSALSAYRATIDFLPQIAALHLDVTSRMNILSTIRSSWLASGAADCAINQADYNGAVELLEASRSIFWSQALHLRSPLQDLESVHHHFALKLKNIARELELASFRHTSRDMETESQEKVMAMELEGTRSKRLNDEWGTTVAHVRELPDFKEFMRPKCITTLRQAAKSGPIVILTGSPQSCSALIVTFAADVQHVPLPQMSLRKAYIYVYLTRALSKPFFNINNFRNDQTSRGNALEQPELFTRLAGGKEGEVKMSSDDAFRFFLSLLWKEIVKPVFTALKVEKSLNPSRLWWCPTGPFSFLPIHAAGTYPDDCVSDYVVSSYTPTVTALLDQPIHPLAVDPFRMTTVIQPHTDGHPPLPGCRDELTKIVARVPSQWLTVLGDTSQATIQTAVINLSQSSIVHFACHGIQDLAQPLNSGLILSDGFLRISEVMRGSVTNTLEDTKRAMSLAFLSACETAMGDNNTPDESMHLAATLLFAGFPSVVATMWSIQDDDGPKIADKFYERLFKNCDPSSNPPTLPDLTKAAEALHYAVAEFRKDPRVSFRQWVSFVHYGL